MKLMKVDEITKTLEKETKEFTHFFMKNTPIFITGLRNWKKGSTTQTDLILYSPEIICVYITTSAGKTIQKNTQK